MVAIKDLSKIYIDKPAGTRVQRQISRMIKHLVDQYRIKNPKHSMPSSWLIDELVINAAKSYILQHTNWQLRVRMTVKQIMQDTSYEDCSYINSRNNSPLFPNNELFDVWEVHLAMKVLLSSLMDGE